MDKENILAAARNQKERGREYETKEAMRSNLLSYAATLLLGMILFVVEYFAKGTVHWGMIALGLVAVGVDTLYVGIRLKKPIKIALGAFALLIAALCVMFFIVQVVAV